ncbi:phage antirepressor KilAC domain-containing protein [Longicatena caecimuris]|uniref:phage antirepressor KilAC domain-containing protein n=1 Tax=Longicatena caecimuris TaxID=1796635 RepID=UPI003AB231EB
MNELQIIEYSNQRVLTTQQLAEVYETSAKNIQMNFANNKARFIEGKHYHILKGADLKEFKNNLPNDIGLVGNRASQLILWTEKGADRHCKILDTDKAWEQFDNLEDTYFKVKEMFNIPKTLPDALRAYADQVERNEKLAIENESMKPKALFADVVSTSEDSILIGQLAKLIKQNGRDIGQNRLFSWMRDNGYLCSKGDNYNLPTQKSMELGSMEIKERTVNNPDGSVRITRTTKVTGKGQIYFVNKLLCWKLK